MLTLVFREAKGVGLLVENKASEGLDEDLSGTDFVLQEAESTTCTLVGLEQLSGTHGILTQKGVDTGEQAEPIFHPDGVSYPVVPMYGPNMILAKLHDHPDGPNDDPGLTGHGIVNQGVTRADMTNPGGIDAPEITPRWPWWRWGWKWQNISQDGWKKGATPGKPILKHYQVGHR